MRERGLKYHILLASFLSIDSRSREGAWIEISIISGALSNSGRSREGAWIEINQIQFD